MLELRRDGFPPAGEASCDAGSGGLGLAGSSGKEKAGTGKPVLRGSFIEVLYHGDGGDSGGLGKV